MPVKDAEKQQAIWLLNEMDVVQKEGHKASIYFAKESTKELLSLLI